MVGYAGGSDSIGKLELRDFFRKLAHPSSTTENPRLHEEGTASADLALLVTPWSPQNLKENFFLSVFMFM